MLHFIFPQCLFHTLNGHVLVRIPVPLRRIAIDTRPVAEVALINVLEQRRALRLIKILRIGAWQRLVEGVLNGKPDLCARLDLLAPR